MFFDYEDFTEEYQEQCLRNFLKRHNLGFVLSYELDNHEWHVVVSGTADDIAALKTWMTAWIAGDVE